jgi:5-methylcytosine-specific restriction endonuclease McrA
LELILSKVFLLNHDRTPLEPVNPARARILLTKGKAAVLRLYPFTIILKEQIESTQTQLRLKLDPGSKTTGLAVLNDGTGEVVFAAELTHRGGLIKDSLLSRRALRRGRRNRHTRYRQARFLNRIKTKKNGWLPPSLMSRLYNIMTWVNRLQRTCPIGNISQELVRFDTQLMQNPEISGVEYQQGELAGYETREYLLEKWGRKCAYCGKQNVPLQVEHINPRARGGSNRISNLTLACQPCNQKKGTRTAAEFGYPDIQAKARQSLKDSAAVNATRWALFNKLKDTGLPVETGSGGLTKYNRHRHSLSKTHWLDAACVGLSTPSNLTIKKVSVLKINAKGWGSRQMCNTNKYGFPISHRTNKISYMGFQTGDFVIAKIPVGKFKGVHKGRVSIRQRPNFQVNKIDFHAKYCTKLHSKDGYSYELIR